MSHDSPGTDRAIPFDPHRRELGILIGFDGSKQGLLALHYAALAAQRSGRVLTVVTAFTVPTSIYTTLVAVPENPEAEARLGAARSVLKEAREYLADFPGKVVYRAERGDAAGVLVDLSSIAELVVVGARGRGGFLGRVLGSVASALPAHADCPTVVVPRQYKVTEVKGSARFAPGRSQRPVVVGVDGSPVSRVAMFQAALAAQNRGVELQLLLALPPLETWLEWYPQFEPKDDGLTAQRTAELESALEAETQWLKTHYPDLSVTATVEPGEPVTLLSRQTEKAQLTVLGTRGRGGAAGTLLGSVSRGVLHRATGPVMVVPHLDDKRLTDHPGFR